MAVAIVIALSLDQVAVSIFTGTECRNEKEIVTMRTEMKGTILATAAALMFMANVALAHERGSASGSITSAASAKVKCTSANDCKGKSACKTARADCRGHNACKGKGFIELSSAQECKDKGGKSEAM